MKTLLLLGFGSHSFFSEKAGRFVFQSSGPNASLEERGEVLTEDQEVVGQIDAATAEDLAEKFYNAAKLDGGTEDLTADGSATRNEALNTLSYGKSNPVEGDDDMVSDKVLGRKCNGVWGSVGCTNRKKPRRN